jgi:hypothetical protein
MTNDIRMTRELTRVKDTIGNTLCSMRMDDNGNLLIYPVLRKIEISDTCLADPLAICLSPRRD